MIEWYYLSIIAAIFSATAAVLQKKVLFKEKALSFATTLALFNLIIAIPFFFFIDASGLSVLNIGVLLIKSILGAFAFLCVMLGIKNLELSHALPLLVLTPGLVALFAFFILGESISALALLGMALLLLGSGLALVLHTALPFWQQPKVLQVCSVADTICREMEKRG